MNHKDHCIDLERIFSIAQNKNSITEDERRHINNCRICRDNLELALMFLGINGNIELEEEKKTTQKQDLQFPNYSHAMDNSPFVELLLAGARYPELTEFPMTYEATGVDKKDKNYWRANIVIHLGKKCNKVEAEEVIERVKIDCDVVSGDGKKLNGKLELFNTYIVIQNGSAGEIMKDGNFKPAPFFMTKDKFSQGLLNPKCSFHFDKVEQEGELLLLDNENIEY